MTIYLIGMMGVGKSTVGKILAEKMKLLFIDLDSEIEKSSQKSVSEIFNEDGENHFRKLESEQLKQYSGSVVACGGGITLDKKNRQYINKNGIVVLLTASINELFKRLSNSNNRPILSDNNSEEALTNLWTERKKDYSNTSDFIINTDEYNQTEIANKILLEINP
ncbi:MAG: shikimate kinase [Candidatus Marinimicrobia bacterium]|jgi:shikimate kinase|nr:shikimate kinase [Candidatus Neomarinimicrobiota bacterium]MBT3838456.1 shikimate kinase [Candidatus Neomarinimicrobiota bacterium]MBT3998761.1 shikimate kinase [Candidatus Neomarinimicrobiota bacterium]MBT4283340.1 shikimate kinase [Candidatus Neomarinimicrobiota bacterium]MBT4578347.1 shikimate kinase [Candidatus Neomarinimicrobiota bacterium]